MRLIMKFGGASIADGEKIKWVAELVNRYREHEIIVVTSALKDVTDSLLYRADVVADSGKIESVHELIEYLRNLHRTAAEIAVADEMILESVLNELDNQLHGLELALAGICYLGELTTRSRDYISSYGELLAAPILSGAMRSIGMHSVQLTGAEAGIITNRCMIAYARKCFR